MSQAELYEHRGYLADERRTAAYRAALAEVVRPTDVVLDLGAGTGVLGCLACEAGASAVIAVDSGDILGLARRIASDNGYADRITYVQSRSTETTLERPVDVVVCDQIGGLVHDAGILRCFADARRRLLTPGGRLVPASFRTFLAPVTFDAGRQLIEFWSSKPASLDASAARTLAVNTEWRYRVVAEDVVQLAAATMLASFTSDHDGPIRGTAAFDVDRPGRLDGFVGWFEAQMSPSVTMTNDPWSPVRFDRWCNFYPVDLGLDLDAGDRVGVDLDVRPSLEVVRWSTNVVRRDGTVHAERHSTFHGSLVTSSTLADYERGPIVPRPDRIQLLHAVLDLLDGSRSQDDVVEALGHHVGTDLASRAHLERLVRHVVRLTR